MPNNEGWYRGNGEDLENYGSSPQPRGGSGHDDYSDSKSQDGSRSYKRESSKSREKEEDPDRNGDRDRYRETDRGKDRDRQHRDLYWYRSERRGRSRDRDDDIYHRSRDYERRRDHDRDRKDRHSRLMSQSRSWGRSEHRSRSLSSSGSKSKRISGFNVAPPASAMLAAASTGQIPGTTPAIPGMFPNTFSLPSGQLGALPIKPVQPLTQQICQRLREMAVSESTRPKGVSREAVAAVNGVDAHQEKLLEIINQVAINIHGVFVPKSSSDHPQYDELRKIVINPLIAEGPNAKLKKASVIEAARLQLKRDITPNDYQKGLYSVVGAQLAIEIVAKENAVTIVDHGNGSVTEQVVDDPMMIPRTISESWKPQLMDDLPDAFCEMTIWCINDIWLSTCRLLCNATNYGFGMTCVWQGQSKPFRFN
ncbi:hypothetical protein F0562_006443 [Nyssa sinensis]|uniref:Uncharacterized protein n=1 Tax=Nyssa sinensis TaxID=561372 RepID=A0A5J5ANM9_9ASTE|nr:hypothetical protein F0562_006443 [Nyssa sinensis]